MKKIICSLIYMLAFVSPVQAGWMDDVMGVLEKPTSGQTGSSQQSVETVSAGLREALSQGVEQAVSLSSRPMVFWRIHKSESLCPIRWKKWVASCGILDWERRSINLKRV